MPDLSQLWGNDLAWSPTGDLATADIPSVTQQRVLRRLLTSTGEYLWALDYGAGLASFVGQPGAAAAIRAAIRGQIFKEAAVAQTPEPIIDLVPDPAGAIYVHIRYADATTGGTQTIAFVT
ncbi:hypothetical protein [Acidisphaera sp. L21]|jgi:hypothetical protein|uniref:hypothetical protein n=1 Tax=Acidisphaera sp. L21 TaxID=1641851 RepID=UPI00131CC124|nr:hypothetical protein [Acidisphaera sp. L21]